MGDTWVHLRMCLICGHVGCCDSSKNKHATKHFHQTQASSDALDRAGRNLDLVLCGRDRGRRTCSLNHRRGTWQVQSDA